MSESHLYQCFLPSAVQVLFSTTVRVHMCARGIVVPVKPVASLERRLIDQRRRFDDPTGFVDTTIPVN